MPHKKIKEFDIFFNLSIKKTDTAKALEDLQPKDLLSNYF
jgi:hypothetical protein